MTTVQIIVDGWGACTVYLVRGRSRLYLRDFYSTMHSKQCLQDARKWARRFKAMTGVEHVEVLRRKYDEHSQPIRFPWENPKVTA